MAEEHRTSRAGIRRKCACGCGKLTARTWVQGHDSQALEAALFALGVDSRLEFIEAVQRGEIVRAMPRRARLEDLA